MRWQRVARIVVTIIGLGGAVAIYYSTRSRPKPPDPPRTVQKLDSDVIQKTASCHHSVGRPGKSPVTIDCSGSTTLSNGFTRLEKVVIAGLEDKRFVIRGDTFEYDLSKGLPSRYVINGHVEITTDDGLQVTGEQATYDDTTGMLDLPGPITYKRGRLSGTSIGATYNRDQDSITLLDQASAQVAADGTGKGVADASAAKMILVRGQHTVQLAGRAKVIGETQTLTGNNAVMTFTEDEQAVKYVELSENARVAPTVRGADQPTMNADRITMSFLPDGITLQHATLTGRANLAMAGATARTIRASRIDLDLASDGKTLTKLTAKDQVVVTLAGTQTTAARTITAASLEATGEEKKGLTRAQFDGGPVFQQEPLAGRGAGAAATNKRKGSGNRLVLTLGGQLDAIQLAEFQEKAAFEDGDVRGEGDIALYDDAKQSMTFRANPREPRRQSHVTTEDMTVDAWTIDVETASENLNAEGSVRTQTKAGEASKGSMFSGKDLIIGTAATLKYVKKDARATYTGTSAAPARLRQGESVVTAEEIDYFDTTRSLNARRKVDSTWLLDPPVTAKPGTPVQKHQVRADTLAYDEGKRTAVYKGSLVILTSPDATIEAETLTFVLAADSKALDFLRAERSVFAKLDGGYEADSDKLEYRGGQEEYKLFGKVGEEALLKSPGQGNEPPTSPSSCTLNRGMEFTVNRKTGALSHGAGQAPKPTTPIACATPIRRSR